MNIIYELPDYWVEDAEKMGTNSTADYVMDDLIVVN